MSEELTSWPLVELRDGVPHWHISGTNPPRYEVDERIEQLWREGEALRMKHDQAIKLARECIVAEIKRLAPLANMAEPPTGVPPMPTPMALRAADRRTKLREASMVLSQRVMELDAA